MDANIAETKHLGSSIIHRLMLDSLTHLQTCACLLNPSQPQSKSSLTLNHLQIASGPTV